MQFVNMQEIERLLSQPELSSKGRDKAILKYLLTGLRQWVVGLNRDQIDLPPRIWHRAGFPPSSSVLGEGRRFGLVAS